MLIPRMLRTLKALKTLILGVCNEVFWRQKYPLDHGISVVKSNWTVKSDCIVKSDWTVKSDWSVKSDWTVKSDCNVKSG